VGDKGRVMICRQHTVLSDEVEECGHLLEI